MNSALPAGERRGQPRSRVREGVKVEIVGRGCSISLTNVGPGGFAITSDENLASVSRRQFRFSAPNEPWSIVISAQMAYCLLRPRTKGPGFGQYVTGFMFSDVTTPEVQGRVAEFLGLVAEQA
jgi:hypothetical protein